VEEKVAQGPRGHVPLKDMGLEQHCVIAPSSHGKMNLLRG
jgi:hypothetical protein